MTNGILDGVDVHMFGECHIDLFHAYEIALRIIEIYKKFKEKYNLKLEYILCEGFDKDNILIFLNKKEEIGLSLKELCGKYCISLEEAGFTREALNIKKLEEILLEVINHINPNGLDEKLYLHYTITDLKYLPTYAGTYEDIVSKPIVTFHNKILDYFLKIVENKLKESVSNKKYSSLCNIARALEHAKSISESFRKHLEDMRPRIYIILSAIYEIGAKIGECDSDEIIKIAAAEKFRQYLEKLDKLGESLEKLSIENYKEHDLEKLKKLDRKLKKEIEELKKLEECWYKLNDLREEAMAASVEKYVKKRKTNAPIIAIMGKAHVKNVAKLLEDRGIRCKVIEFEDSIKDPELIDYVRRKYLKYLEIAMSYM